MNYYFTYKVCFYDEDFDGMTEECGLAYGSIMADAIEKVESYYGANVESVKISYLYNSDVLPIKGERLMEEIKAQEYIW